ncbi:MAG: tetraacyldisaccharide 4'-kinase [Halioglobus sp.]
MASGEPLLVEAWYRKVWWLWLLRPLEGVFRLIARIRRNLYSTGLLGRYKAEVPVVVVGNITVGGTGKTPVVLALIEQLQTQGLKPGLVSRGYGATASSFPHAVGDHSTAADCGDEALLIFQRTGCPCVVSPSRVDAVKQLAHDYDVDLILSDDGLQHYALDRSMEIAVLDKNRGVGNGFCLPAGPLREPLSRLQSVDYVLWRGSDDAQDGFSYQAVSLVNVVSGEEREVSPDAIGRQVYAVAGIGQPQQFFASLAAAGFDFESRIFDDHYNYQANDLADLRDRAIIMTEKDAVKYRVFAGNNVWFLKISAQLPQQLCQSVIALASRAME